MKLDASDIADLRPVIVETVRAVLGEIENDETQLPQGRIGYLEPEAAALLGVRPHVLRDGRQRGLLKAVRLGKAYVYSRSSLIAFVNGEQRNGNGAKKKRP